jgi:Periplasmic protease
MFEHSENSSNTKPPENSGEPGAIEFLDVFYDKQLSFDGKTSQGVGAPPARPQPSDQQNRDKQACPPSPKFNDYIDGIARKIYDPTQLGNLDDLKNKYNCQIERTQNPAQAVRQYLASDADPYSQMMDKAEYKAFKDYLKGNTVDVGIHIRQPNLLEEKSPIQPPILVQDFEPVSTARDAGIMRGDQILEIDGKSLAQKTHRHARVMLEGEENTKLKLKVLRDGKELEFTVDRKRIESPAISVDKLNNGDIVRIRVHSFMQDDTSDEIANAVRDNPQAKGFILDLRHNGGGLVDQAAKTASVFIKEGKVMTMRSRVDSDPAFPRYEDDVYNITANSITHAVNGERPTTYRSRQPDLTDKPLVVLIDQGTASASEIVAGALKDTDGAYLIGTSSYGKGIGQTIFPDEDTGGATKYTTFAYYTPSNIWVGDGHEKRYGLTPNKLVANPRPADFGTAKDGQVNAAVDYLQSIFPKEPPADAQKQVPKQAPKEAPNDALKQAPRQAPNEMIPLPRTNKSRASDLLERLNRKPSS